MTETEQEKEILDRLTAEDQAWFLQGGDLQQVPEGALDIQGAAGINIVNRVYALPNGGFAPIDIPERYNWGMLAKSMKAQLSKLQGEVVCRYATAWPVEMLLAQTWNTPLLEKIGKAVGAEAHAFGITVWLAPV